MRHRLRLSRATSSGKQRGGSAYSREGAEPGRNALRLRLSYFQSGYGKARQINREDASSAREIARSDPAVVRFGAPSNESQAKTQARPMSSRPRWAVPALPALFSIAAGRKRRLSD